MADEKISALPSAGALAGTEPLPIVQGGVTKKTTVQDVADLKATPDLQQVTTAGATTSVGIIVDNGAGESLDIKHDLININNALGTATITSPTLTSATEFRIPNKLTNPQTFAMLSDVFANPMTTGGDIIYGGSSGVPTRLANGTAGQVLQSNGTTLAPSWAAAGGGGDAYLANDQTFTGENTFAIGSGNDTPVTITKGGNGAGLKVTKSSGSGDAIEVADGSVSIADETASTIASFDGSKRIKSLATSTYPSLTELALVKGVTGSDIQTQINGKLNLTGGSLSGALNEAQGSNIASAATTDIGAATGNYVVVTGTTTITALGTVQAGTRRIVNFSGILILTHNGTSLILPTSANITTAAGDTATFVSLGSGNWVCVNYMRASGAALVGGGGSSQDPISSCADGTAVTGVTTNSYSKGLLIPANSRAANNAPQVDVKVSKTPTNNTVTIRLYWNTTDDLVGSPILLGLSTALPSSTRATTFMRILSIVVADGTGNATLVSPVGVAGQTDYAAYTAVQTSAAIDWTAAGYLICAVQNASAADSSVCNMIKLH
jgi:hypothetical protein